VLKQRVPKLEGEHDEEEEVPRKARGAFKASVEQTQQQRQ
jgi:hypothetical protein